MADLTMAMDLSPSSIYAAFGDKHALFSPAVKRYLASRAQYATRALEEPTRERVIRALFGNTVAFLTTPGHPPKSELKRTAEMALHHLGYGPVTKTKKISHLIKSTT